MLTRRYIRIKVLQELFALTHNPNSDYLFIEEQLISHVNNIYDLYIRQLSFLLELRDYEIKRQYTAKKKYFPTSEDINPNTRFINNRILIQFENNLDYQKHFNRLKINWSDSGTILKNAMITLTNSDLYKNYISTDSDDYEKDRLFILKYISTILPYNDELITYYEEKNSQWVNDFDATIVFLEKTIRTFTEDQKENRTLPPLYGAHTDALGSNDDERFLKKLFSTVVFHSKEYDAMIAERTNNWDFERIPSIDIIIIKMAIAEFLKFDSIPIKVTLNEYIELSKLFSTPKSSNFINGLLDRLLREFTSTDQIHKIGRGLIE